MRQEISNKLRDRRSEELQGQLASLVESVERDGYKITFGEIGTKTTYAFLQKGEEEILGYTFIKDLRYKNETVGQLKALQQALLRKSTLEQSVPEKGL